MIIFKQESADGLADSIASNTCIAYCSPVQTVSDMPANIPTDKVIAEITKKTDQFDLFPLQTILATTGWNINKDIFANEEMWNAQATPEDKPFNLEHRAREIIGHITGSAAIDDQHKIIPGDTPFDSVPDKFHILTSAVIYKSWDDPEYQAKINKIIAEISAGQWYVSMECLFRGFDYGIQNHDGSQKVVARNAETAYLTKYLRQYGGVGEYNGQKIGRVLRNMSFSGKGLVRNPANPESIIFDNHNNFTSAVVYSNNDIIEINSMEHKTMADESLDKIVADLRKENAELIKTLASHDIKSVHANINSLTEDNTKLVAEVSSLKDLVAMAEKKVKDKDKEMKDMMDEKTKSEAAKKDSDGDYEKKAKEMYGAKTKAERLVELLKSHVDPKVVESASALIAQFGALDDDMFTSVVKLHADAMKTSVPDAKPIVPVVMKGNPLEVPQGGGAKYPFSSGGQQNTRQVNASVDVSNAFEPTGDQTATASNDTVDAMEKVRASIEDVVGCYMNTYKNKNSK